MKKIIGIFGVVAVAVTLSLNSISISNNEMELASLVTLGTANAEVDWWNQVYNKTYYYQPWDGSWLVDCYLGGNIAC